MSPVNITNLLVKLVAQNNALNNNSVNRNVNSQPQPQTQQAVQPQTNLPAQTANSVNQNINLNDNVNNILNRELVNRQIMNNVTQNRPAGENVYSPATSNLPNNPNNILNQQSNFINQANTLNVQNNILNAQNGILNSSNNVNQAHSLLSKDLSSKLSIVTERNQNINNVKTMMKLPQEMKDVLSLVQQTQQVQQSAAAKSQDAIGLLLLSNINIKNLTQLIQNGSKEALNQLMTATLTQNLSKAEMKQIEEAISYLNASSSSLESQTQALKNFMLLYLPWLPLQEGMDFELDFSFKEGSEEDDENILNIVIMTRNFGEIHILIILKAISSFEIYVQCCKNFPKHKLLKLVEEDENKYTMKTNMVFEEQSNYEPKAKAQEAKITLSHVKEISPFLLLIANSIIKNTLLLDSKFSKI